MFSYFYYLYNCLYVEQCYRFNYKFFRKSHNVVELRVRVKESDIKVLMDRLSAMLEFFGKISGVCGKLEDITDLKKHSSNVVEVSLMLSGIRAVLFKRMVDVVIIPSYVVQYGFKPEWVSYESQVKIFFNNPSFFFNYVGGTRDDFQEHIILTLRNKYV